VYLIIRAHNRIYSLFGHITIKDWSLICIYFWGFQVKLFKFLSLAICSFEPLHMVVISFLLSCYICPYSFSSWACSIALQWYIGQWTSPYGSHQLNWFFSQGYNWIGIFVPCSSTTFGGTKALWRDCHHPYLYNCGFVFIHHCRNSGLPWIQLPGYGLFLLQQDKTFSCWML
jgi:hypothetical protein